MSILSSNTGTYGSLYEPPFTGTYGSLYEPPFTGTYGSLYEPPSERLRRSRLRALLADR